MHRRGDLMERLAAADPLRDGEQLTPEEEREAEALLARLLAAPAEPAAPQRRPWRPRMRLRALAAVGVASAAAAFATINLVAEDGGGRGVVEKAIAAVARDNSVYHLVERRRGTSTIPGARVGPFYAESWYSSDGRRHEKVFAAAGGGRGRLLEEIAGRRRPGLLSGPLLRYDPRADTVYPSGFARAADAGELPFVDPHGDPGAGLRALEERGLLRLDGETRLGGVRAYRLVSESIPAPEGDEQRFEYLVDSETYLPLVLRGSLRLDSGETLGFVSRFLVYERLPLDSRSEAKLDLDPHPGATCAIGAGELTLGFPNPCPPSGREGPARAPWGAGPQRGGSR